MPGLSAETPQEFARDSADHTQPGEEPATRIERNHRTSIEADGGAVLSPLSHNTRSDNAALSPLSQRMRADAADAVSFEDQVSDIQARFDHLSRRVQRMALEMRPAVDPPRADLHFTTPTLAEIVEKLTATGLDEDLSEGAARSVLARAGARGIGDQEELLRLLAESLAGVLSTGPAPASPARSATGATAAAPTSRQRIVALVGPPGAGKTTTAVKMAAIERHGRGSKCLLIAADRYRIGAVEQLTEYAELIGVSIASVRTVPELAAAIARHEDADLILIDTPGHAPADSRRMSDLKRLLEGAAGADLLLVLPATTRRRDLAVAISRFRALAPPRLVFTKLDETSAYGELLSEAAASGCPVAAFTMGQTVPDDLEQATPARFAELVVRAAWAATKES